jgi:hypothetical protein
MTDITGLRMLADQTAAVARMNWRFSSIAQNHRLFIQKGTPWFGLAFCNQIDYLMEDISRVVVLHSPEGPTKKRLPRVRKK